MTFAYNVAAQAASTETSPGRAPLLALRHEGKPMAITDWPAAERPREKLLARGAGALSDAELLALFLRVGIRGHTVGVCFGTCFQ